MLAPPRVSRTSAVVVAVALSAMALGIFIPLVWKVVVPYAATGTPPADWTWTRIAIAVLVLLGGFGYMGWIIYRQFATLISDDGVTVPTIHGKRFTAWSNIRRVGSRGYEILLDAPAGVVTVNLACFRDRDAVMTYIQTRLAAVTEKDGSGSAV